jgi:hypothetical protein
MRPATFYANVIVYKTDSCRNTVFRKKVFSASTSNSPKSPSISGFPSSDSQPTRVRALSSVAGNYLRGARTRRFITAPHQPLFRANWTQSAPSHSISPRSFLIPSTPRSSEWPLSFMLSQQNLVHFSVLSSDATTGWVSKCQVPRAPTLGTWNIKNISLFKLQLSKNIYLLCFIY